MNWKELEKNGDGLNGILFRYLPGKTHTPRKTSFIKATFLSEISNRDIPKTTKILCTPPRQ